MHKNQRVKNLISIYHLILQAYTFCQIGRKRERKRGGGEQ